MKISTADYGDFPGPGLCHVQVAAFDEYGEPKSGAHVAKLEILASTTGDDVGKVFKDFIPDPGKNPKTVFRLIEFLVGCGMLTRAQIKESQENDSDLDLDPADCVGRQMFVELVEEEYNGKTSTKIKGGRSYFKLDDPKCSDWPTNKGMLARAKTGPAATAATAAAPASDSPF